VPAEDDRDQRDDVPRPRDAVPVRSLLLVLLLVVLELITSTLSSIFDVGGQRSERKKWCVVVSLRPARAGS